MKIAAFATSLVTYCTLVNLELTTSAAAQIAPDNTLSTTVSSPNNLNFVIEGGDRSGSNLFHSFSEFSVPAGGTAFFNNPIEIQNIFSRVMGGNVSNINGVIGARNANLFLMNPAGIIFGPNAQLLIGGSFVGTTATGIAFADGTEFSATNVSGSSLLTLSVPTGLQMGDRNVSLFRKNNHDESGLSSNCFVAKALK
jgi:filamentous hemagglutinin family protein